MQYKDFLENKSKNKNKNKKVLEFGEVNVTNNKDLEKGIFSIISGIAKIGFKTVKVIFKTVGKTLLIVFKYIDSGLEFVACKLQMKFHRLESNKQDRVVKTMVLMAFLAIFGLGVKFTGVSNANFIESASKVISIKKDSQVADNKNIEVEFIDESTEEDNIEVANAETVKARTVDATDTNINTKKDTSKIPNVDFFGTIAFESTIGSVDPGYMGTTKVRYEENGKKKIKETDTYGLGEFTTIEGRRYAEDFTDYIKTVDSEFYDEYFEGVGKPGTITFTTAWYSASKTESEKFKKFQFDYIYMVYIKPTVDVIEKDYNLDLMSSDALKEFIFSTVNQYKELGTLTLFEKAKISSTMSDKEIIEAVQKEKIDSLGKYTYTDEWSYTDKDREKLKARAEKELELFLELLK